MYNVLYILCRYVIWRINMESNRNTIIAVALIIGLVIGAPIGYYLMPPKTIEVEVPGEPQTIIEEVPALSGTIPIGALYANTGHIDTSARARV
jgi:hypothetical protein